jgi:hypothetical protein
MTDTLSDFISRSKRVAFSEMESELTPEAKALRRKFNLPINRIVRPGEVVFTIPFDPVADAEPVAKIVNAHDLYQPVEFAYRIRGGGHEWSTEMEAEVKDVQVRHQKNWKTPRLVVTVQPLID